MFHMFTGKMAIIFWIFLKRKSVFSNWLEVVSVQFHGKNNTYKVGPYQL